MEFWDYDDDDDDDDYIEEYGEESVMMREKQNKWGGWGKKVVMTGIVISSAPLLLPPFLVVSALGFAMSVPSAVVLATYACTQKLMTKLLPPPLLPYPYQQQQEEEEDDDDDDDGTKKMSEDIKKGIEMRIGLVDDEQQEIYNYAPNNNDDVQFGRERELEDEREMSSSSSSSENGDENENADVEEIAVKQALANDDAKKQGNHQDYKTTAVNVMVGDDDTAAEAGVTEDEPKKVADDSLMEKDSDDTAAEAGVTEDEAKMVADESLKEKDSHGNGGEEMEMELIDEEKIWEKIDAIRVIVGFKAPRRSSYVQELRALYLFTGIDPPTTPTSSHQSHHFSDLNFLMSVIGLK